jgi:hypothetical protein
VVGGSLYEAVSIWTIHRRMVGRLMNDELQENLEGSGQGLMEPLLWHLPRGTEKYHEIRDHDSRCFGRHTNPHLPEYKSKEILQDNSMAVFQKRLRKTMKIANKLFGLLLRSVEGVKRAPRREVRRDIKLNPNEIS